MRYVYKYYIIPIDDGTPTNSDGPEKSNTPVLATTTTKRPLTKVI